MMARAPRPPSPLVPAYGRYEWFRFRIDSRLYRTGRFLRFAFRFIYLPARGGVEPNCEHRTMEVAVRERAATVKRRGPPAARPTGPDASGRRPGER